MADEGGISKEHNFVGGADVMLRRRKRNKWSTPYKPVFYTVIKISGLQMAQGSSKLLINSNLQKSLCTRRM